MSHRMSHRNIHALDSVPPDGNGIQVVHEPAVAEGIEGQIFLATGPFSGLHPHESLKGYIRMDRQGVNSLIRELRRVRDRAFEADA